jgi:hypothetical protein
MEHLLHHLYQDQALISVALGGAECYPLRQMHAGMGSSDTDSYALHNIVLAGIGPDVNHTVAFPEILGRPEHDRLRFSDRQLEWPQETMRGFTHGAHAPSSSLSAVAVTCPDLDVRHPITVCSRRSRQKHFDVRLQGRASCSFIPASSVWQRRPAPPTGAMGAGAGACG